MSATGLTVFDETLQKTNIWLADILQEMGWQGRQRAYHALRAVLHTLRDRLPPNEAVQFAAELPLLVRGIYYEGWHLGGKPLRDHTKDEFLTHVATQCQGEPYTNPEHVTRGVLRVLRKHISRGEFEDVRQCLPGQIRELCS